MHDDTREPWQAELSPELIAAIRRYVWPANVTSERSIERAEFVDAVLADERQRRGVGLERVVPGGGSWMYKHRLPDHLMKLLKAEVIEQPVQVMIERGLALGELLGEERLLLIDREKLLGHLLLRHGEPARSAVSLDPLQLARRHAQGHGATKRSV